MKRLKTGLSCLLLLLLFSTCSKEDDPADPIIDPPETNGIEVFLTTRYTSTLLSRQSDLAFSTEASSFTIRLDTSDLKQEIDGFGGTLTGSSAFLIKNMEASARDSLLKSLFGITGIGIKSLRITIGSSDFSVGNYTYCDTEGIEHFAIPDIDKRDLLPVLKEIRTINPDIKLIASPWTAPAWMKSNKHLYGGSLTGEAVYDDFAEYFVRYIRAFEQEGVPIDAITLQNEPQYESNGYPTMRMSWSEQNTIIRDYLGEKFKAAGIRTKILLLDHNFDEVNYPILILNNSQTRGYVSGVAFHGYAGTPADIDPLLTAYPDVPIYFTEQSGGGWNTDEPIGNMLYYMKEMLIPVINRGARNFLMWNVALDQNHGPVTTTQGGCQDCRGIVTISDTKTFLRNEEYYLLGHFSGFLQKEARRIGYTTVGTQPANVVFSTFLNLDGSKVMVALNQSGSRQTFTVRTGERRFTYALPDQSAVTFVYK